MFDSELMLDIFDGFYVEHTVLRFGTLVQIVGLITCGDILSQLFRFVHFHGSDNAYIF